MIPLGIIAAATPRSVTPPGPTDPYWANVVSLLHFDGADGSTTFPDETGKVWTPNGNAQIDTAQAKFGGASGLFDGTGDYLTTPHHGGFNFGGDDFTIEAWARASAGTIIAKRTTSPTQSGWALQVNTGHQVQFVSWTGSGGTTRHNLTGATVLAADEFAHVAVAREGDELRIFVDGALDASQTVAGAIADNSQPVYIGSTPQALAYAGHMDDLRVTAGVARYTTSFTPPDAPFPNS